MSENQSPQDANGELTPFQNITARSRPALFKMVKEGEEDFYFDSADLSDHKQEFEEMGNNGWKEEEKTGLPAYLQARLSTIKQLGFVPSGWGYKKE